MDNHAFVPGSSPGVSSNLDTFFMVYGIERAPPPLPVVVWSSWLGLWTLNPAARVRIPVRPYQKPIILRRRATLPAISGSYWYFL
jgi:hypothetical protein